MAISPPNNSFPRTGALPASDTDPDPRGVRALAEDRLPQGAPDPQSNMETIRDEQQAKLSEELRASQEKVISLLEKCQLLIGQLGSVQAENIDLKQKNVQLTEEVQKQREDHDKACRQIAHLESQLKSAQLNVCQEIQPAGWRQELALVRDQEYNQRIQNQPPGV